MDSEQFKNKCLIFAEIFSEASVWACRNNMCKEEKPAFIPELDVMASSICKSVSEDVAEFAKNIKAFPNSDIYVLTIAKCCLTIGMGAAALWKRNPEHLEKFDLYRSFVKDYRYIGIVDQQVYNYIGLQYESARANDFLDKNIELFYHIMHISYKKLPQLYKDGEENAAKYMPKVVNEVFKIMYKLGISFQAQGSFE